MDWTPIKAALAAWAAAQSGLAATAIEWRDGPRTMMRHPYITLRIIANRGLGIDQRTYAKIDAGPPGADLAVVVSGNRLFTLSIEARSRDNTGNHEASAMLEELRTSLRKPSVLEAFRVAKIGVVRAEQIVDVSQVEDGRQESRAVLDVAFSTVARSDDTPTTYIEKMRITSNLSGTAHQIDDETFPP